MAKSGFLFLWGLFILLAAQKLGASCPRCPKHSECVNGTFCICKKGYTSKSQHIYFTDPKEICEDIDECANPAICRANTYCINHDGGYLCSCFSSFYILHTFLNFFRSCSEDTSSSEGSNEAKNLGNIWEILNNTEVRRNKSATALSTTHLLHAMETKALEDAFKPKKDIDTQNDLVVIATQVVPNNSCSEKNTIFTLKAGKEVMDIYCTEVIRGGIQGKSAVAFLSYAFLGNIIDGSYFEEQPSQKAGNVSLNSKVVSGTVGFRQDSTLGSSVILTFQNLQENYSQSQQLLCVYWKHTEEGGGWSREGCFLLRTNGTHIWCSCNHLSTFAVLMSLSNLEKDDVLTMITYVGLSLSLLCLFLAALTFLLCRPIQNTSTSLHLQLSLCLFLADLLFLTGIEQTSDKILCSIIAGGLHYLYLASFTWMFLEGLYLFLTVRNLKVANYTSAGQFKKIFMYPFGYGIPAVIVGVSAGIDPYSYGTDNYCWLNLHKGFIWSFVGPVILIILLNLIFYLMTLWILKDKLSTLNKEVSTIQNTRTLTFKAIVHFFILGCSWSLSFFLTEAITETVRLVFAYIFTIVNSLQGIYIFLVYCVLNHQVQGEYRKWFKGIQRRTETDSSVILSSPTTHSKVIEELEKSLDFSKRKENISSPNLKTTRNLSHY